MDVVGLGQANRTGHPPASTELDLYFSEVYMLTHVIRVLPLLWRGSGRDPRLHRYLQPRQLALRVMGRVPSSVTSPSLVSPAIPR